MEPLPDLLGGEPRPGQIRSREDQEGRPVFPKMSNQRERSAQTGCRELKLPLALMVVPVMIIGIIVVMIMIVIVVMVRFTRADSLRSFSQACGIV